MNSTRSTCWKSTVADTVNFVTGTVNFVTGTVNFVTGTVDFVADTVNFVTDTVDFVTGFVNKSATTWIRQLVAVDFVANMVDFVASVYGVKATRLTFQQIQLCLIQLVTGVYRAKDNGNKHRMFVDCSGSLTSRWNCLYNAGLTALDWLCETCCHYIGIWNFDVGQM